MGAFRGRKGTTVLVRNHELARGRLQVPGQPVVGRRPYDPDEIGGTTAIVVGRDRRKVEDYVTSSGTRTNCAGGRTPWRTWLSCEEDTSEGHGYVFEVVPAEREGRLARTPIKAVGRFSHEAAVVDPRTGLVYLTEDDHAGVSFMYRYLPHDRRRRPGALQRGGRLQALAVEKGVVWRDVDAEDPHAAALRVGARRFRRPEGADFGAGALWFSDTTAGERGLGRIYRYRPARGVLELLLESRDPDRMRGPDNVVLAPWGELWFTEGSAILPNRLMGLTRDGSTYEFARPRTPRVQISGPCFAPDGRTFFLNQYAPGMTFAVWGPFSRRE
jgi:uncharacterized protein